MTRPSTWTDLRPARSTGSRTSTPIHTVSNALSCRGGVNTRNCRSACVVLPYKRRSPALRGFPEEGPALNGGVREVAQSFAIRCVPLRYKASGGLAQVMDAHGERRGKAGQGYRLIPVQFRIIEVRTTAAIACPSVLSHGVDGVDTSIDEQLQEAVLTIGEPWAELGSVLKQEGADERVEPAQGFCRYFAGSGSRVRAS